jgi:beta-galactosidase
MFEPEIRNPLLWSPDSPALYTCEVKLTASGRRSIYVEKIGFRRFEFVKNGPFLLNGKRLLLKGTHRHEDHAGVAAAMTEDQIVREMQLIKAMGVNFIRLGHYQQSRIVLEQCDRLGILVWEEIPWCRGGLGGAGYRRQARKALENMIGQHGNHPSIILWGLGNENDWPNDFPVFDKQQIRAFMSELNSLAHRLDSSRMTCIRRCDFCKDIVDVYSPSIWAGWYRGVYTGYRDVSHNEMQQVDHFLHAEWGGDSHARRHAEDPYAGLQEVKSEKNRQRKSRRRLAPRRRRPRIQRRRLERVLHLRPDRLASQRAGNHALAYRRGILDVQGFFNAPPSRKSRSLREPKGCGRA